MKSVSTCAQVIRGVFLVSDELLKLAFRNPSDYRDRRLSDLTPDQIDRVLIRTQGGEIELVRDATGWRIVKPLHALADELRVEDFLKQLLGQRIVQFVAGIPVVSASLGSGRATTRLPSTLKAVVATKPCAWARTGPALFSASLLPAILSIACRSRA